MSNYKKKILLLGYLYFLIIGSLCFYLKLHFVFSTLLFIVVPILVLIYLKRGIGKELSLFAWSLGVPVGFYTQIIAERNNIWKYIPFLPSFQLKDIPFEALLWYPCWFGLVIATYLFFFDKHKHLFKLKGNFKRHSKYFLYCLSIFVISLILINLNIYYSVFPHAYISLISPLVLISIFLFLFNKHKRFLQIFIPTTIILFLPMLFYDLIGVYSHQWVFPGPSLYTINFGFAKLPIEEFVIWLWIWPASVIAYFEEFESDFQ